MSKWRINMNKSSSLEIVDKEPIPTPNGFVRTTDLDVTAEGSVHMSLELQLAAKQRQVMAIAYGPGKALLTTGFMLWMSGSSVQIFSIMMTGMALINPLKAIVAINDTFKNFEKEEGVDLKIPKLVFISLQILSLGVALYNCSRMGLLPLTAADWVSYLPTVKYMERSVIPV